MKRKYLLDQIAGCPNFIAVKVGLICFIGYLISMESRIFVKEGLVSKHVGDYGLVHRNLGIASARLLDTSLHRPTAIF